MPDDLVNVRYMVNDVQASIDFYTQHFGFEVRSNAAPAFADVVRGRLRLLLAGPKASAGRPMPDGRKPAPGGWDPDSFRRPGHQRRGGAAARCRRSVSATRSSPDPADSRS